MIYISLIRPISLANICCEKTALLSSGEYARPRRPIKMGSKPDPTPEQILENTIK